MGELTGRAEAVPLRALAVAALMALTAALLALTFGPALLRGLAPESAPTPIATRAGALTSDGLLSLPLAARGQASAVLGAADPAYRVSAAGGSLVAANPAQRMHMRFGASGVSLGVDAAQVGLGLRAIGYGDRLRALGPLSPRASTNRVLYTGDGVREWYVNGPLGLEQGFAIPRAPAGHPAGPLTLSIALSGDAHARLAPGGGSVTLAGTAGSLLRYGSLSAADADGRRLHSWIQLSATGLLLRVDTRGARYPLRIDPLVQQGAKLSAEGASFGASVALSADGDTALIGAAGDNGGRGAAWVFTRTGETWSQQGTELTGGGESGAGEFGASVALSGDGDTALIGATGDDDHTGAAWVFTRAGSTWTQQGGKLTGGGEVGEGWFGRSVALSEDGNTALVGAFHDNDTLGAAWAFTRSGETWSQQGEKLVGSGGCGTPFLGSSVALSADGDAALIGAAWDCDVGAAWVFTRSGSTWTQQGEKLRGSGEVGKGFFGESVALSADGNTALMGAPSDADGHGAAWVFTRSGATWTQQGGKLTGGGEIGEGQFGRSVAISGEGDTALIGGSYENTGDNGAAWVFARSGSTWTQQGEKLRGSGEDDEEGALGRLGGGGFGADVALSSDAGTALIGGGHGSDLLGAAWVFVQQPHAAVNEAEFGRCVLVTRVGGEHYRGLYSTHGCTKTAKNGRFEWYSGVARTHFTTRIARGEVQLESAKRTRITCSGEMGAGEYSGAGLTTVGGVVFDLTGCKGLGQKCSSPGAPAGEIATGPLEGTLGIARRARSGARSAVALDLAPTGGAGSFAVFSCGATSVTIRGSLVGASSSDRMGSSSTLSFSATKGIQRLQGLVGDPAQPLEASFDGGPFERIGLRLVTTLVDEEAMEARLSHS